MDNIEKLKAQVDKQPNSTMFVPLAEEYRKLKRLDEAIEVLKAGIERQPGYMTARVALGKTYLEKDMKTEAKAEFEKVVKSNPDNFFASKKLADLYRDLGELDNARTQYNHVLMLNPQDDDALKFMAIMKHATVAPKPAAPTGPTPEGVTLPIAEKPIPILSGVPEPSEEALEDIPEDVEDMILEEEGIEETPVVEEMVEEAPEPEPMSEIGSMDIPSFDEEEPAISIQEEPDEVPAVTLEPDDEPFVIPEPDDEPPAMEQSAGILDASDEVATSEAGMAEDDHPFGLSEEEPALPAFDEGALITEDHSAESGYAESASLLGVGDDETPSFAQPGSILSEEPHAESGYAEAASLLEEEAAAEEALEEVSAFAEETPEVEAAAEEALEEVSAFAEETPEVEAAAEEALEEVSAFAEETPAEEYESEETLPPCDEELTDDSSVGGLDIYGDHMDDDMVGGIEFGAHALAEHNARTATEVVTELDYSSDQMDEVEVLHMLADADMKVAEEDFTGAMAVYSAVLTRNPSNAMTLQKLDELKMLMKILGKEYEIYISRLNTLLTGIKKRRDEFFRGA